MGLNFHEKNLRASWLPKVSDLVASKSFSVQSMKSQSPVKTLVALATPAVATSSFTSNYKFNLFSLTLDPI